MISWGYKTTHGLYSFGKHLSARRWYNLRATLIPATQRHHFAGRVARLYPVRTLLQPCVRAARLRPRNTWSDVSIKSGGSSRYMHTRPSTSAALITWRLRVTSRCILYGSSCNARAWSRALRKPSAANLISRTFEFRRLCIFPSGSFVTQPCNIVRASVSWSETVTTTRTTGRSMP